ncbi:MAG: 2-C-methyl-D-erythritol 4-phosphate cytidylyltransferase [Candidatus Azobacteroides sp.]|nr:2-C-methyl-D-erythritol 4-phosphate cytidylyltransferase [Candidatus Azobacteroides sp.]
MKKYVLVMAGGKGLRMGNDVPKQFLPLNGKPVLMHTLEAFYRYDSDIGLILVLPDEQREYWVSLCEAYSFVVPHSVTGGGETRFHSVKNGLEFVENGGLVAVHDGVRPFVSTEVIAECFRVAENDHAVIPVIDVVETIRKIEGDSSRTVDRNAYKLVQTPQIFQTDLLKKAYEQPYTEAFTDDASVVEASGKTIRLVPGNRENIKITTPFDLLIGEAILKAIKK